MPTQNFPRLLVSVNFLLLFFCSGFHFCDEKQLTLLFSLSTRLAIQMNKPVFLIALLVFACVCVSVRGDTTYFPATCLSFVSGQYAATCPTDFTSVSYFNLTSASTFWSQNLNLTGGTVSADGSVRLHLPHTHSLTRTADHGPVRKRVHMQRHIQCDVL